jgi:hypothetical protein
MEAYSKLNPSDDEEILLGARKTLDVLEGNIKHTIFIHILSQDLKLFL